MNCIPIKLTAWPIIKCFFLDSFDAGNNSCWDQSLCEHLCFALNETEYRCQCATGFVLDPKDNRTCRGAKSFLLFSTTTGKNIRLTCTSYRRY